LASADGDRSSATDAYGAGRVRRVPLGIFQFDPSKAPDQGAPIADKAVEGREVSMRKNERTSRAKRAVSAKARGSQAKRKVSARNRKPARRVAVFKSTSWYASAAQSIGITPRAAP
jgi:hypothetical protein